MLAILLAAGALQSGCWYIIPTTAEDREAFVRKQAEEKFEEPKPDLLAWARRPEVDFNVSTKSTRDCAGNPPQKLVIVNAAGTHQLELKVTEEKLSNAAGVTASFFKGSLSLPDARFKELFAVPGRLYLVAESGRVGEWPIDGEGGE